MYLYIERVLIIDWIKYFCMLTYVEVSLVGSLRADSNILRCLCTGSNMMGIRASECIWYLRDRLVLCQLDFHHCMLSILVSSGKLINFTNIRYIKMLVIVLFLKKYYYRTDSCNLDTFYRLCIILCKHKRDVLKNWKKSTFFSWNFRFFPNFLGNKPGLFPFIHNSYFCSSIGNYNWKKL